MNGFLSTVELEKHVRMMYGKADDIMASDGITVPLTTIFKESEPPGEDGTTCFSDGNGYHLRVAERGRLYYDDITQDLFEITYRAIKNNISEASSIYEAKNRVPNQDFRRIMFAKRLQLFAAIGPEYAQRAKADIRIFLQKAPFKDG